MAELAQVVRVVVVSPGDVQAERRRLQAVVDELNHSVAPKHGWRLVLWRWETDAWPGLHLEGPQGQIDEQMKIDEADLVIGIFWKRFGTPTHDAASGTQHELHRAWSAWRQQRRPQVMVYFCDRRPTPKDNAETTQLQQVLNFRDAMPKEQLWSRYTTTADFERAVRKHLTAFILNPQPASTPAATEAKPLPKATSPSLLRTIDRLRPWLRIWQPKPRDPRSIRALNRRFVVELTLFTVLFILSYSIGARL